MPEIPARIIDSCALINLYTGWGGLQLLKTLPFSWTICDAVAKESEFTREYGKDGRVVEVKLDLDPMVKSGLLQVVKPESEIEQRDYIVFAAEIDDGEAQSLAIAKTRKYILATDDRKTLRLAQRPDVAVVTISTVGVLQQWQNHANPSRANVRLALERIQQLARFAPRRGSDDLLWWVEQLRIDP